MADITMCKDNECKNKNTCYRYNAPSNQYYQSYFADSPRKENDCEYYWDYEGRAIKSSVNQTK
jgi:hypothetical protein